jgi:hypothetical protein
MPGHVLILGCGRSGTSIFGELFESIPGYKYYSEPAFEDVVNLDFGSPVAIKVPRESAKYPAPPGLSFPIDTMISAMSAQVKIFWQVRHPLDAIASLRPGISNNWGHHPRPEDWREWLERPLIERCAHHWAYINKVGYDSVKELVEVCHFEEMIREPLAFALKICEQIGVDHRVSLSALAAWADRVQDTNNDKFIEAGTSRNLSRPDHKYRVGRWRENLNVQDVKRAMPIIRGVAENFGYQLPADNCC